MTTDGYDVVMTHAQWGLNAEGLGQDPTDDDDDFSHCLGVLTLSRAEAVASPATTGHLFTAFAASHGPLCIAFAFKICTLLSHSNGHTGPLPQCCELTFYLDDNPI